MTKARRVCLAIAVIVMALTTLSLASAQVGAKYEPPRLGDGKPDLQGIWQVRNTANWDLEHHAGSYGIPAGLGVVVDPAGAAVWLSPKGEPASVGERGGVVVAFGVSGEESAALPLPERRNTIAPAISSTTDSEPMIS